MRLARSNCQTCHKDHHLFQENLLKGETFLDIGSVPALMEGVQTNCMGCHLDEDIAQEQHVLKGSNESCKNCHTDKHKLMPDRWKNDVDTAMDDYQSVLESLETALSEIDLATASEKVKKIPSNLNRLKMEIQKTEYGNGVHNKKFSILLIDEVVNQIDLIIEDIEESQQ